ncbi:olfactory receptor 2A12-like [Pholidichthys leucotaenia]
MDVELNLTYVTLGGHVEVHKYRYLYFLLMFTAYILIILFNGCIIRLIVIHRNLHEPMYIFIAALLLNSVLFSTNIYPKLLIDFLSEKQIISYQACLLQIFIFYALSCSEFVLLAAMAYDRYVSICKPLQYPTIMRKSTVNLCLGLAWLVPACQITVPIALEANAKLCSFTLKGIFCNNSITRLNCVTSRVVTVYGVIVLLNISVFPLLFILFTYAKIFIITHNSQREVRRKAVQTCLPHLLVLISFSCLVTYDVIIVKLESSIPQTARLIMTLQVILYHPLFNPIMYGLKMKEISKHIKRLYVHKAILSGAGTHNPPSRFVAQKTFHIIKDTYCVDSIKDSWMEKRREIINRIKDREVVLIAEGRIDSPSHCAQYCTYTATDDETKDIISVWTVDRRQTDHNSVVMEKKAFMDTMTQLFTEVKVVKVCTDAHSQISAIIGDRTPSLSMSTAILARSVDSTGAGFDNTEVDVSGETLEDLSAAGGHIMATRVVAGEDREWAGGTACEERGKRGSAAGVVGPDGGKIAAAEEMCFLRRSDVRWRCLTGSGADGERAGIDVGVGATSLSPSLVFGREKMEVRMFIAFG